MGEPRSPCRPAPPPRERRLFDNPRLSGSLPATWTGPASRLRALYLSRCGLGGPLPPALQLPNSLERLLLDSNGFNGSIPGGIWPRPFFLESLKASTADSYGGSTGPGGGGTAAVSGSGLQTSLVELHLENNLLRRGVGGWGAGSEWGSVRARVAFSTCAADCTPRRNRHRRCKCPAAPLWMRHVHVPAYCPTLCMMCVLSRSGTIPQDLQLSVTVQGVYLFNNSLEGQLPAWPSLHNTAVYVRPGNSRLCGEVRTSEAAGPPAWLCWPCAASHSAACTCRVRGHQPKLKSPTLAPGRSSGPL